MLSPAQKETDVGCTYCGEELDDEKAANPEKDAFVALGRWLGMREKDE